jgi:hypothetical protein
MREFAGTARDADGKQHCIMRNFAKRQYGAQLRDPGYFRLEIAIAANDFVALGLIPRRQAFHCIGDAAIDEPKAV